MGVAGMGVATGDAGASGGAGEPGATVCPDDPRKPASDCIVQIATPAGAVKTDATIICSSVAIDGRFSIATGDDGGGYVGFPTFTADILGTRAARLVTISATAPSSVELGPTGVGNLLVMTDAAGVPTAVGDWDYSGAGLSLFRLDAQGWWRTPLMQSAPPTETRHTVVPHFDTSGRAHLAYGLSDGSLHLVTRGPGGEMGQIRMSDVTDDAFSFGLAFDAMDRPHVPFLSIVSPPDFSSTTVTLSDWSPGKGADATAFGTVTGPGSSFGPGIGPISAARTSAGTVAASLMMASGIRILAPRPAASTLDLIVPDTAPQVRCPPVRTRLIRPSVS